MSLFFLGTYKISTVMVFCVITVQARNQIGNGRLFENSSFPCKEISMVYFLLIDGQNKRER